MASDKGLRGMLRNELGGDGVRVCAETELLGIDYQAGGKQGSRSVQVGRRRKVKGRHNKVAWWRALGGNAGRVTEEGLVPSVGHGGNIVGFTPAAMRDLRKMKAATARVRCAGTSMSVKLAVGGARGKDIEPLLTQGMEVVTEVFAYLWDPPLCRHTFIKTWLKYRAELDGLPNDGEGWKRTRGPIGAAIMQLRRVGIEWHKPFRIKALEHEIDLLVVPPPAGDRHPQGAWENLPGQADA